MAIIKPVAATVRTGSITVLASAQLKPEIEKFGLGYARTAGMQ